MSGATVALVTVSVVLGVCDPPEPPLTRDERAFHETCVRVVAARLGEPVRGVLGPVDLAAARDIVGVSPDVAFAVRHDRGATECRDERPGDWFLAHRVDLSNARVEELERLVRDPSG